MGSSSCGRPNVSYHKLGNGAEAILSSIESPLLLWFRKEKKGITYWMDEGRRIVSYKLLLSIVTDLFFWKTNWYHIVITSYQLAVQDAFAFKRKKWYYLILDEAQNIKNFQSQRWQTLINFNTQRRLLLTGTPLQVSSQLLVHYTYDHDAEESNSIFLCFRTTWWNSGLYFTFWCLTFSGRARNSRTGFQIQWITLLREKVVVTRMWSSDCTVSFGPLCFEDSRRTWKLKCRGSSSTLLNVNYQDDRYVIR